ncbi:MAG: DUF4331 family protein [Deltaproteobacteria bacterium]|nr:DUF4331 family protein [Deltaproteobacteria bacterium]MBK8718200.1 DUF4331 family protein [Deltaproteobacteria bacterium]MBP7288986.1 DUF4331 family protein [Nannocystaceae bacterium]
MFMHLHGPQAPNPPRRGRLAMRATALTAIALAFAPWASTPGRAADHADSPGTQDDPAADITDVFAWHSGSKLVVGVGFAGLAEAGQPAMYDPHVLYTVHIDNDGDGTDDHQVYVRFGSNDAGEWGVKVEDLPGVADPVIGPVDTVIDAGLDLHVFAGQRDDAFFFDLDGFHQTLRTGDLSFVNTRDTFAGTNVTMFVVEMSLDAVAGGGDNLTLWVSSGRNG